MQGNDRIKGEKAVKKEEILLKSKHAAGWLATCGFKSVNYEEKQKR